MSRRRRAGAAAGSPDRSGRRRGAVRAAGAPTRRRRAARVRASGRRSRSTLWPCRSRAAAASRRSGSSRWCEMPGARRAEHDLALGAHELRRPARLDWPRAASAHRTATAAVVPRARARRASAPRGAIGGERRARRRRGSRCTDTGRTPSIDDERDRRRPRRPSRCGARSRFMRRPPRRVAQLVAHRDECVDRFVSHLRPRLMLAELCPFEEDRETCARSRRSSRARRAPARRTRTAPRTAGAAGRRRRGRAPCARRRR